jgi:hypothetical protein
MTFISYTDGVKAYFFMRLTNYVFTAVKALFNENIYPRCPHMQHPDFVDIRPPTNDGNHNTPLGDYANDDDDWYDNFPDLPQHQNAPHRNNDMSNPLDPDKSINDDNKIPLPATLKEKQRAVKPPTTPRQDRKNPVPEQGNIPVSPMPSNAPHLSQNDPMGLHVEYLSMSLTHLLYTFLITFLYCLLNVNLT